MQGVIDRHRHASLIGCIVFQDVSVGAMLAMLVDTMSPEAFAKAHDFAGLARGAGLLDAFALGRMHGRRTIALV